MTASQPSGAKGDPSREKPQRAVPPGQEGGRGLRVSLWGVTEWKPECMRAAALKDAPINVTVPGLNPCGGFCAGRETSCLMENSSSRGHFLRGQFPPSELLRMSTACAHVCVRGVRTCVCCVQAYAHMRTCVCVQRAELRCYQVKALLSAELQTLKSSNKSDTFRRGSPHPS